MNVILRKIASLLYGMAIHVRNVLFDKDILAGRLGPWEITKEYLRYLDVLVDGPFVEAKKNLSLRFRGSENQRLIDVPASLRDGEVILWQDWQGERKGLKV